MKLTMTRTPIYIDTKPVRTRVVFFRVDFDDDTTRTWSGIENGDDPDKIPAGVGELVMTRMHKSKRPALWLEGTDLFIHALGRGDDQPFLLGKAKHLKGCSMPCRVLEENGGANDPDHAIAAILSTLGGFEVDKRVPFECIDLEEVVCETCSGKGWCDHSAGGRGPMAYGKFPCPDCMPDDLVTRPAAPEWELVDVHDGAEWDDRNETVRGDNLNEGCRWTRLPDGDVMIERRKK